MFSIFRTNLGKAIAITLAIFGVVSLASKMTVVTKVNEESKIHHKQYIEQIKQQEIKNKQISTESDTKWKHHTQLEDIGRSLFSIKYSVEKYENKHNEWPEDMTTLGLQSEEAADGKYTKSIKIDDGQIYAFLMPEFGEKKILHLHYTGGYPNKWSCTTNLSLKSKKTIAGMPCTEKSKISFDGRYFQ